jgi:hypothetical protein
MAAGSRLYFTQNLLQRDENAQKKIFDTINPAKNIIFWKISVIFGGIVKAGHKITRCNCCCPKSSSAASPAASFPHSREFPLPAALPRQPLVRSLSVLSRSRYCAARKIACKPFHSSGLRKRGSAAKRSLSDAHRLRATRFGLPADVIIRFSFSGLVHFP